MQQIAYSLRVSFLSKCVLALALAGPISWMTRAQTQPFEIYALINGDQVPIDKQITITNAAKITFQGNSPSFSSFTYQYAAGDLSFSGSLYYPQTFWVSASGLLTVTGGPFQPFKRTVGISVVEPTPLHVVLSDSPVSDDTVVYSDFKIWMQTDYPHGLIVYTTDGTEPTPNSNTYTNGLLYFQGTTRLRAVTYTADFSRSYNVDLTFTRAIPTRLTVVGMPELGLYSSDTTPRSPLPTNGVIIAPTNTMVTLEAVSSNGWTFKEWRGYTNSTNPIISMQLDRNREIGMVHIHKLANPPSVELTGGGQVLLEPPAPYDQSDNIQVTALPDQGSYFAGWSETNGESISASINVPAATASLHASFKPLDPGYHSLSLRIQGAGTFVPTSLNEFTSNSTIQVEVQPAPGWVFTGWNTDAYGSNSIIRFQANTNVQLIANTRKFERWRAPGYSPAITLDLKTVALRGPRLVLFNDYGLTDWEVDLDDQSTIDPPAVGPDGNIYIATSHKIWSVSRTGRLLWGKTLISYDSIGYIGVAADGVYCASYDAGISFPETPSVIEHYAFSGRVAKEMPFFKGQFGYAPLAQLLSIDAAGNTYAEFLQQIISFAPDLLPRASGFEIPIWYAENFLALGTDDRMIMRSTNSIGLVLIVDRKTGRSFPALQGKILDYPVYDNIEAAAADDGSFFVLASVRAQKGGVIPDTLISRVSPEGQTLWEALYPYDFSWRLLLAPDGVLYLSGLTGQLLALQTDARPARSGWSMRHANYRNTRQALIDLPQLPRDTLMVADTSPTIRIQYLPSTAQVSHLEISHDLKVWTAFRDFTGPLDIELLQNPNPSFLRMRP